MRVDIIFNCDPSVGDFARHYQMEIPDSVLEEKENREWAREQIAKLYTELDGEYFVNGVYFEDEITKDL